MGSRSASNTIDGLEAERIGLVSLAVPDDQLQDKARDVSTVICMDRRRGNAKDLVAERVMSNNLGGTCLARFHAAEVATARSISAPG